MSEIYQKAADAQRPCFAILRRTLKIHDGEADFRAPITLEDGRRYVAGVTVTTNRHGETELRLFLRAPLKLSKTPVTPRTLDVVRP
jgi:hypothetical protein